MPKPLDVTGQKFGRLTALHCVGSFPGGRKWHCQCECGGVASVAIGKLTSGHTQSCGCLHKEKAALVSAEHNRTHGESKTPEYNAWINMILRCDKEESYLRRGITVCDLWKGSYQSFLDHIGRRPDAEHSLDRIDNNKGYEPGNVRWATRRVQNRNKSSNVMLTLGGKSQCLKEWTEELNLKYSKVVKRLKRGWSLEKALELI